MSDLTNEQVLDYIDFLEALEGDLRQAAHGSILASRHAPEDRKKVFADTSKFLSVYADTFVRMELMAMRLKLLEPKPIGQNSAGLRAV